MHGVLKYVTTPPSSNVVNCKKWLQSSLIYMSHFDNPRVPLSASSFCQDGVHVDWDDISIIFAVTPDLSGLVSGLFSADKMF